MQMPWVYLKRERQQRCLVCMVQRQGVEEKQKVLYKGVAGNVQKMKCKVENVLV
jgi:hypothetical protein